MKIILAQVAFVLLTIFKVATYCIKLVFYPQQFQLIVLAVFSQSWQDCRIPCFHFYHNHCLDSIGTLQAWTFYFYFLCLSPFHNYLSLLVNVLKRFLHWSYWCLVFAVSSLRYCFPLILMMLYHRLTIMSLSAF